ncbi:outer membrane beta-barrel protein [Taibaiella koreensis]|uniref:outer membrane beta-barrel protein n=1 Tax=Taibaiella koreensis TaxID=1268548 RepID=UPI000E59F47F|nr:outer membrane beta-barrel protein [Taibaiella koreensis]
MRLISLFFSFALLLPAMPLHAQWMHVGLDGILGLHYNTLDAASYKTPVWNAAVGAHLTIADPDNPRKAYFNGRLTFENDFETYTVWGNIKQDFSFRDLVGSLQVHQRLNDALSVYVGLNLSVNVINTVALRSEGSVFKYWGQRSGQLEAEVRQSIRKLNAGLEAGFMYPLGNGFNVGLHATYYLLKRLNEDLDLVYPEGASLNFRPVALKAQCTFDFL